MLRRLFDWISRPRRFRLELARQTPLIHGWETRRVARAIGYRADQAGELICGAVDFEPRETYCERVLEWAFNGGESKRTDSA